MFWKTFVLAFFVVGVLADEYELTQDKKDYIKTQFAKQCEKNGAADKIDEVANSTYAFAECLKGIVDVHQLQNEINEAKPNGALDEVFKKYCAKTPQLKTCIHNVIDGVSPCIEQSYREQIPTAKNGTDQLIDFICYKDGDRIALFISEHGPECFKEKMHGIKDCATKMKDTVSTVEAAKALTMVEKCTKFDELSNCVVKSLEECSTPTPGNMAESLFRYIRKGTPCNTALPPK